MVAGGLVGQVRRWLSVHDDRRQVASNTGWILVERVVTLGASVIVSIVLARYLGTAEFGLLNYALAIVAIFVQLARLGMSGVLVRELVVHPDQQGPILGTAFAVRLLSGLVTFGVVALTAVVLLGDQPIVGVLATILAIGLVFDSLIVIESHFQGLLENRTTAALRAMVSVTSMASSLVLVVAGAPIVAFAIVVAGESVLLGFAFLVAYRRRFAVAEWRVRTAVARSLLAQSWPLILSGVTASVYLKIDQVMLGAMSEPATVGLYAAAVRLSEGWYFIPTAIATAAFPVLLRAKSASESAYDRRLQQLYDGLFWAALGVIIPVSLFADFIVVTLYGDEYRAAGPILALHVWAGLFIFLRAGLSKWLIAEKLTIFSLATHGSGAVVNIGLNLWLIPAYGAIGAAAASLVSYAVASYFSLFLHPRTRRPAVQMTLALLSPIRLVRDLYRRGSSRAEHE